MSDFNKRLRRYVMSEANRHLKFYKEWHKKHPELTQNIDISMSKELKRVWELAKKLTKNYTDKEYKFYTDK